MQAINAALIDTIAACGDVNRNVMVSRQSASSRCVHAEVYECAAKPVRAPAAASTRAYYEIWLDEERVAGSGEEDEPIYGPTYLPRKFKIGIRGAADERRRRVRERPRLHRDRREWRSSSDST